MSIRVTCTGCHTRFNVSEKFAGREGPCPKCKSKIKIPTSSEKVEVHAPESFGPTDTEGRKVLEPVFRNEAKLSPVEIVLIIATITGLLAVAGLLRIANTDPTQFSSWLLLVLAVVVAVPCVYGGYTFLRDSELGSMTGQDLWIRVACCSVVYGLLWISFYLANLAMIDDYGTATSAIAITAMFVIGAVTANLFLGLDFLMGAIHFGLYFGVCLLLRLIAGFTALPGSVEPVVEDPTIAWFSIQSFAGGLVIWIS